MSYVVGLTGGIASGKSTITKYLIERGYKVIDADMLVHNLYKKGNRGYEEVIRLFGDSVDGGNYINRRALSDIVINDLEQLNKLNNLIHPIIRDEILKEINLLNGIVFLDIPLLFEASFDDLCDRILLIYVSKDVQVTRLIDRDNITKEEALKRISIQMPLEEKKELSDYVIDNSFDVNETYSQLDKVLEDLDNEQDLSNK